jgi:hypothetical protein
MALVKECARKATQHTVYKDKNGNRLPGVTTVLSVINKPFLIPWANKMGLDNVVYSKYMDNIANLGTLVHYLCECYLKGIEPDLRDYSISEVEFSKPSYNRFLNWMSGLSDFELIGSEVQVISEKYGYGGSCDLICKINGRLTLIDIKTSDSCYPEHKTQVVAYKQAYEEQTGNYIDDLKILRLGRGEGGSDIYDVGNEELHLKRFLVCLELYKLNKELKADV